MNFIEQVFKHNRKLNCILKLNMVESTKKPEDMCRERPKGHGPEYMAEWQAYSEFKEHCKTVKKATFDTYSKEMQLTIIRHLTIMSTQGVPMTPNLASQCVAEIKVARQQLKDLKAKPAAPETIEKIAQPTISFGGGK